MAPRAGCMWSNCSRPPVVVGVFSGDIAFPTVSTSEPSPVTETSATLRAHLDPDAAHGGGEMTACTVRIRHDDGLRSYGPVLPGTAVYGSGGRER